MAPGLWSGYVQGPTWLPPTKGGGRSPTSGGCRRRRGRRSLEHVASDDEFRRVAEDVRALARSLGRDLRAAYDQAREEFYRGTDGSHSAVRSARDELTAASRAARREWRQARTTARHRGPYRFPQAPPPDPA